MSRGANGTLAISSTVTTVGSVVGLVGFDAYYE